MINKETLANYINEQPIKVVENFNFETGTIQYSDEITQNNTIKKFRGEEELVRAFILTKLVNELGYPANRIEIETVYKAGRPHTITSRIDIIVRDSSGNAFLFMELKSPNDYIDDKDEVIENQLFKLANMEEYNGNQVNYLVLYTVNNEKDGQIDDECIVIDKLKNENFTKWEINREYLNELPERYGKAQKKPFKKGSNNDLKTNFTITALNALQKDLHNVLWGGGATDDNEVFSSLVNLILAKIQDEDEKNDGDIYDFQSLVFENHGEDEYESNQVLFERVNRLYRDALKDKLNVTEEEELNKSYVIDTKKFSLSKLKYTVQQLEGLSFVDGKNSVNGKDILGDFFEAIIRDGFKQTKGQFFTPMNIVKFMLLAVKADKLAVKRILDDKEIPYMIDPSGGSGTFIIEYMKFITENMKYKNSNGKYNKELGTSRAITDKIESDWFYPDNRENKWAKDYIYTSEINFNLGTATKVNMILHGDGSSNVFVKDGLASFEQYEKETAPNALRGSFKDVNYSEENKNLLVNGQFDLILTNPPFSVDLDNDTKKTVKKQYLFGDKKNSENLFIERWYQLLRENGRVAAVLPESVFDTTENKYIRLFMYKFFKIKAVVSLPQITFEPYTSTKTSILFLQKKTKVEIDEWNNLWSEKSNEYNLLKTRVENLIKVYEKTKEKNKLPSIKELTQDEEKNILVRMLRSYIKDEDDSLSSDDLIEKYSLELKDLCKYDKDTVNVFGYVNTWWVFGEVAEMQNYNIFMAEAENVGYKRTKRGEKLKPNDLYRVDIDNSIIIDDGKKEKILDYMREINWD